MAYELKKILSKKKTFSFIDNSPLQNAFPGASIKAITEANALGEETGCNQAVWHALFFE